MTQQDHTVTANMNRLAPAEERIIGPKNDTTYVSPASIQHFTFAWASKHIGRLSPPIHVFSSDSLPVFELPPGFSANRTDLHFLGNFRLAVHPAADSIDN